MNIPQSNPLPETIKNLEAKAEQISEEFEAMFVSHCLKMAYQFSLGDNELLGGGYAEDTWQELLVDEYAKNIAKQDTLGVKAMIKKQIGSLMSLQEV